MKCSKGASLAACVACAIVLLVSACADAPEPAPVVSGDPAYERLAALQFRRIDSAAANLSNIDFTRTVETVAYSDEGDTVAFERVIIRHEGGRPSIVDSTRRGDFRQGFLARLVAPSADVVHDTTDFQAIVPQDPPYLSGRWKDAFSYDLVALQDIPAVEVERREGEGGEGIDLQHALFLFDAETNEVIGIRMTRQSSSALGEWTTMSRLDLEQVAGVQWVPRNYIYSQARSAPLQRPYRFTRRVLYDAFAPRG